MPLPAPVARAVGVLLFGALAACATPQTDALLDDPKDLRARAEIAAVPFFPQEKYYCGPAALAMALAWSGLPVTQADIAPQVYTPGREGTLPADIIAAARRNGRLAVPISRLSDLLAEVAAGHPVVVFQNLGLEWYTKWHFAVAVGYDLEAREIVLRSGLDARRRTPLATFEHTWARADYWAVAVMPPERLPVTADERTLVRAAAGLERAGRFAEAEIAYAAILDRWPASFGALMGLGNARFSLGDPRGAEAVFRRLLAQDSHVSAAWNNLAHALARQGRRSEAIAAARNAVRLGGGHLDAYRATLREVSGSAS